VRFRRATRGGFAIRIPANQVGFPAPHADAFI
jgi:hypothetical protein